MSAAAFYFFIPDQVTGGGRRRPAKQDCPSESICDIIEL